MAIASLILGILSFLIALIPCGGAVALIPGLIGLTLGICAACKKTLPSRSNIMQILGIIFSGLALAIAILWICFSVFITFILEPEESLDYEYYEEENYITSHLNDDVVMGDLIIKIEKTTLDEKAIKPKDGYQYVSFQLDAKNISFYEAYLDNAFIKLACSNGISYNTDYHKVYSNTTLKNEVIESGEIISRKISFEIPNDVNPDMLLFDIDCDIYKFMIK